MSDMPPYPPNTILVVEVGSTAHGTGLPGKEDHDEIVIVTESPEDVFGPTLPPRGVQIRTQPRGVPSGPGDVDRTVYTLRHFLHLAATGNPSIIMVFWAPVIDAKDLGMSLRKLGPAFIGRHLIDRYVGYMDAQVGKLMGWRGGRHGKMRDDDAGYDTKYAMHAARLGYQGIELLTTRKLDLPIQGEAAEWLRSVRRGEVAQVAWYARTISLREKLTDLHQIESLDDRADIAKIARWSYEAHMAAWFDEAAVRAGVNELLDGHGWDVWDSFKRFVEHEDVADAFAALHLQTLRRPASPG